MSSDSSSLWDLGHQVSAFSVSLSGGSSPAKSFPINMYIPEKSQFTDTHSLQIRLTSNQQLDGLVLGLGMGP